MIIPTYLFNKAILYTRYAKTFKSYKNTTYLEFDCEFYDSWVFFLIISKLFCKTDLYTFKI